MLQYFVRSRRRAHLLPRRAADAFGSGGRHQASGPRNVPLIAWRLRDIAETAAMCSEDLHTCANCHSFSADGKTLGMDLDGPQNDKGLYTLVPVQQKMTIRNQDVISWTTFRGEFGSQLREWLHVSGLARWPPRGHHHRAAGR